MRLTTSFAIFVSIGSSFRVWSTAIVAETEKSPYSFFTSRDLFFPTAHWPRSLLGSTYPGDFGIRVVSKKRLTLGGVFGYSSTS